MRRTTSGEETLTGFVGRIRLVKFRIRQRGTAELSGVYIRTPRRTAQSWTWIGSIHGLDWIGLGQQNWTHVQLWDGQLANSICSAQQCDERRDAVVPRRGIHKPNGASVHNLRSCEIFAQTFGDVVVNVLRNVCIYYLYSNFVCVPLVYPERGRLQPPH